MDKKTNDISQNLYASPLFKFYILYIFYTTLMAWLPLSIIHTYMHSVVFVCHDYILLPEEKRKIRRTARTVLYRGKPKRETYSFGVVTVKFLHRSLRKFHATWRRVVAIVARFRINSNLRISALNDRIGVESSGVRVRVEWECVDRTYMPWWMKFRRTVGVFWKEKRVIPIKLSPITWFRRYDEHRDTARTRCCQRNVNASRIAWASYLLSLPCCSRCSCINKFIHAILCRVMFSRLMWYLHILMICIVLKNYAPIIVSCFITYSVDLAPNVKSVIHVSFPRHIPQVRLFSYLEWTHMCFRVVWYIFD